MSVKIGMESHYEMPFRS